MRTLNIAVVCCLHRPTISPVSYHHKLLYKSDTESALTERGNQILQCQLRYLVKGVYTTRGSQQELTRELEDLLPNAESITVLPVVQGYSVDLEIRDIAPFNRVSFEPYIADHVLADSDEAIQIQLLKASFF